MQEKLLALQMIFNVSVRMTAIVLVCSAQYLLGENNGCHFAFHSRPKGWKEKKDCTKGVSDGQKEGETSGWGNRNYPVSSPFSCLSHTVHSYHGLKSNTASR